MSKTLLDLKIFSTKQERQKMLGFLVIQSCTARIYMQGILEISLLFALRKLEATYPTKNQSILGGVLSHFCLVPS